MEHLKSKVKGKGQKNLAAEAPIPAPLLLLTGYALAISVAMVFENKKLCLVVTEKAGHREIFTFQADTITESFHQAACYLDAHEKNFDFAILSAQGHLKMNNDVFDMLALQIITQDSFDDNNKTLEPIVFQCYQPVGESFGLIGEASLAIKGQILEPSNDYWLPLLKEGIAQLPGAAESWPRWQNAGTM